MQNNSGCCGGLLDVEPIYAFLFDGEEVMRRVVELAPRISLIRMGSLRLQRSSEV